MTLDQMIPYAAGVVVMGAGTWAVKMLWEIRQLVTEMKVRQEGHGKELADLDEMGSSHGREIADLHTRVVRIEAQGCSVKGQCLPRPG